MKNGIPFDVAFSVDDMTRQVWSIIFSEHGGNAFDWDAMEFKEQQ